MLCAQICLPVLTTLLLQTSVSAASECTTAGAPACLYIAVLPRPTNFFFQYTQPTHSPITHQASLQLPFYTSNNMRLTSTLLAVFASVAMAVPATLIARDDAACTPSSYTVSDYTLTTSLTSGSVDFTFTSTFSSPDTITDLVQDGAHCSASGPSVPNSNECEVANRRLLFDLRGPQEQAYYQITHMWSCNGGTWLSGNAVKIDPLACRTEGDKRICTGGFMTFAPQNVRKICSTPTC
jgi:hypothetical protein